MATPQGWRAGRRRAFDIRPVDESERLRAVLRDRLRHLGVRPLVLPTPSDPRLADACRLVTDDLSRPRTAAWLAHEVGTSGRTLARLFRTGLGTTYPQWRTTARVLHAMVALAEGATISATAHRCGWATTSTFVAAVTRTMGQTPGAYRRAALADP